MVANIDCMEAMKKHPDQYFDLAVCDPPCGIGVGTMNFVSRGKLYVKQKNGSRLPLPDKKYAPSDWDIAPPPQAYFDEVRRVSKHQIIWCINYFDWQGVGPGRIKWDKCIPDGVGFSRYEYAYCSMIEHEMTVKILHSGMMQAKSLREPTTPQGNKKKNEVRIHPCQKPKILYHWIYTQFAQEGWHILDTHLGSGNSRIVAHKMGLNFTGFEIDTGYYAAQEAYFAKETALPLFSPHKENLPKIFL